MPKLFRLKFHHTPASCQVKVQNWGNIVSTDEAEASSVGLAIPQKVSGERGASVAGGLACAVRSLG